MELYRRYAPALVRKGQRLLGNTSDAEDIVQALFVELIGRGQIGEAGETDTTRIDLPYLYRAMTNRCLNVLRDRDNRQRLLERHDAALRGPVRTRCDDEVIGIDLLTRLCDRLDERSVEILVYRYFDDMPQEEIAELVGTSRKTVGKRLDRIREEVRALTGGAGGTGSPGGAGGGGQ